MVGALNSSATSGPLDRWRSVSPPRGKRPRYVSLHQGHASLDKTEDLGINIAAIRLGKTTQIMFVL